MKNSLLKWVHHLCKGTTWGYATRKDVLVMFGFLILLTIALAYLYYWIGYALGAQEPALDRNLIFIFVTPILLTIIATFSLIFMRINDIFGRRCFTSKLRIFAFFFINQVIRFIMSSLVDLLFLFILFVYPPSSREREEMPIVEYKLPKKTVIILSLTTIAILSLSLYWAVKDSKNMPLFEYSTSYMEKNHLKI